MHVVKCTKCKHDLKFRREIKESKIKCKYCGNVFVGSSVYTEGLFDTTIQTSQFQDKKPEAVETGKDLPRPIPVKPTPVPVESNPVAASPAPAPVPVQPKPVPIKPKPAAAEPQPVPVQAQPVPIQPVAIKPQPAAPKPHSVPIVAPAAAKPRRTKSSGRRSSSAKGKSSEERDEAKERRMMFLEMRRQKKARNRMILIAVLVLGLIGVVTGVVVMSMTPPPEERSAAEKEKNTGGRSSGGGVVQPGPGPGTVPGTGGTAHVSPPGPGTTPPGPGPGTTPPGPGTTPPGPGPSAVTPPANKGSKYVSVLGCTAVDSSMEQAQVMHVGSFLNGTWDPFDPAESGKKPNPCMEWAQVVVLAKSGGALSEYRSPKFYDITPGVEYRYSVQLPNGAEVVSQYCEHPPPLSSSHHGFALRNFSRKDTGEKLILEGDAKNPLSVDLKGVKIICDIFSGQGAYLGTARGSFYLSRSQDTLNAGKSKRFMMEFDMSNSSHSPDDNDLRFVARLLGRQG